MSTRTDAVRLTAPQARLLCAARVWRVTYQPHNNTYRAGSVVAARVTGEALRHAGLLERVGDTGRDLLDLRITERGRHQVAALKEAA